MEYIKQASFSFFIIQSALFLYSGGFDYELSRRLFWLLFSFFLYQLLTHYLEIRFINQKINRLDRRVDNVEEIFSILEKKLPMLIDKLSITDDK